MHKILKNRLPFQTRLYFRSRHEFLTELKTVSKHAHQKLDSFGWLLRESSFQPASPTQIYLFHASRDITKLKLELAPQFREIINYMSRHFDSLSVGEKAIAFRLLATLNPGHGLQKVDEKWTNMLARFERDFLDRIIDLPKDQPDLVEVFDLVDLVNYLVGFSFYRFGANANLHVQAKSTNLIFETLISSVRSYFVPPRSKRTEQMDSILNEINWECWLLSDKERLMNAIRVGNQLQLLDRHGLSLLYFVLIRENFDKLSGYEENQGRVGDRNEAQRLERIKTIGKFGKFIKF
jgi:hypothetical protein